MGKIIIAENTGEILLEVREMSDQNAIRLLTEAALRLTLRRSDLPDNMREALERHRDGGCSCGRDHSADEAISGDESVIVAPPMGYDLAGLGNSLQRQSELRKKERDDE